MGESFGSVEAREIARHASDAAIQRRAKGFIRRLASTGTLPLLIAFLATGLTPAESPPEQAASQPSPAPEDSSLPQGVVPPKLLSSRQPVFPGIMDDRTLEADVALQAVILSTGAVGPIRVLSCGVHHRGESPQKQYERHCPAFEASAVKAVKDWKYEPARMDGKAVDVYYTIRIGFHHR